MWLNVSKASCRSKNTPYAKCPESQTCYIFSLSAISVCMVERLFLKPNCFHTRHFVQLGNLRHIYEQVFLLFCSGLKVKRLVINWYKEKGPRFWRRRLLWLFLVKNPVEKERLIIKHIDLLSSFWNYFKNLMGKLNGPEALFLFKSLILFRTSCSIVGVKRKVC